MVSEYQVVASTSDRLGALELMNALARRSSCLVEIGDRRWWVLARTAGRQEQEELLQQVADWIAAHPERALQLELQDR